MHFKNIWLPIISKKCVTDKECYDKKTALTKINFKRKFGVKLRAYECSYCERWHVSSYDKNRFKYK